MLYHPLGATKYATKTKLPNSRTPTLAKQKEIPGKRTRKWLEEQGNIVEEFPFCV